MNYKASRSVSGIMLILTTPGAVVAGYYGAAAAAPGITIFEWFINLSEVLYEPFRIYYNEYTFTGIGVAVAVYWFMVLYYYASKKKYRFGREQGSAEWGNVREICKRLSEPDDKNNASVMSVGKNHVTMNNRLISQNIAISLDTTHTDLNNNVLAIGGTGAGKTFKLVIPNMMQLTGSYIFTDPKGELARRAGFFKGYGYDVVVINILNAHEMKKSSRYNPFRYVTCDEDIVELADIYMEATKKSESQEGDQYWTDMAGLLLQAFMYYAYYVGIEVNGVLRHDFKGLMHLVNKLQVLENPRTGAREPCEVDFLFKRLEKTNPEHLAVISYNKAMGGAADTVRSIISTLNSRMTRLQTESVLDLLSDDEVDIDRIGTQKTVVFCCIPDNDRTYNFIISMLYRQMFRRMYYQADFIYGGTLPVHVTFMLDEFSNVKLPDNFLSLLSTMRSRNISSFILIQNMAQIKKMYKNEEHESIPANCSTVIYLGNNEPSTHKWISEQIGNETIDKRSSSESKGRNGNFSKNNDIMQRPLMYPDEIRKKPRKKCIVLIDGEAPVYDDKIKTWKHPLWKEFNRLSKAYRFDARLERAKERKRVIKFGGDNNMELKLYTEKEVDLFREQDAMAAAEYEEDLRIAKLTGDDNPPSPTKRVLDVSLQELMWLIEHEPLENDSKIFTDGFNREEDLEERLGDELAAIVSDEGNEAYYDVIDYEADESEAGISDMGLDGRHAEWFAKLSRAGFSAEQIEVMIPAMEKIKDCRPEYICSIVSPDYDPDTIRFMLNFFCKQ